MMSVVMLNVVAPHYLMVPHCKSRDNLKKLGWGKLSSFFCPIVYDDEKKLYNNDTRGQCCKTFYHHYMVILSFCVLKLYTPKITTEWQ
jgi:hypothetical protein